MLLTRPAFANSWCLLTSRFARKCCAFGKEPRTVYRKNSLIALSNGAVSMMQLAAKLVDAFEISHATPRQAPGARYQPWHSTHEPPQRLIGLYSSGFKKSRLSRCRQRKKSSRMRPAQGRRQKAQPGSTTPGRSYGMAHDATVPDPPPRGLPCCVTVRTAKPWRCRYTAWRRACRWRSRRLCWLRRPDSRKVCRRASPLQRREQ